MYRLHLDGTNSTVTPEGSGGKYYGFSLRCLAQTRLKIRNHPDSIKNKIRKNRTKMVPKSFRLPTGGPSGEYQTLYNNYNSWTAMQDSAGPQFVLSGYRLDTGTSYQGTYGIYWSSSAATSATDAYSLVLRGINSTVSPAYGNYKLYGFTLRCLAKKGITTLKSPSASQPVALLENTKHSTITIIAILL